MKKILSILSVLILIFTFSVSAFAEANSLVDDKANLFTDSEKSEMITIIQDFISHTGLSLAVVTANDAEGKSAGEYADDYYDNLIVSEGWSEDGVLFLIDMDNREVYISTAGECIYIFPDYAIEYIIDCGYNELTNENYSLSVLLMTEAAYGQYDDYYEESENGDAYYDDEFYIGEYDEDYETYYNSSYSDSGLEFKDVIISIIIAAVIGIIAVVVVKSQYKNMGKGDEFDADDISLNLTGSNDSVISKNVITTRIPKNNNKPGGKGGGGVSVHRSSGGFSHGGGGRKF